MNRWYVLFSKPCKEFHVRDQLVERDLQVYLPLLPHSKRARRAGRRRRWPRPLFPRYLFTRLDASQTSPSEVRWIPGLTGFVTLGGELATVEDSVIEHIRTRLEHIRTKAPVPYKQGQRVCLPADHPLAMLDAVFEKPLSDGRRACILIEVVGRLTRCEIDMDDLQAGDRAPFSL